MLAGSSRAGQVQGAASLFAINAVQRLHQAGVGFGFFTAQFQDKLFGVGAMQVHQLHAGLAVFIAGLVNVPHDGAGQFCEACAVAAG